MDERAAEIGPLQHATGKLPGTAIAETGQADLGQQRIGAIPEDRILVAAKRIRIGFDDLERQHDVLADRQPGQHGRVLERHADPHLFSTDLTPGHENDTLGRAQKARDQFEDGRLAAAGRADHGDEIAGTNGQIGAVQRQKGIVAPAEANFHVFELCNPCTAMLRRSGCCRHAVCPSSICF